MPSLDGRIKMSEGKNELLNKKGVNGKRYQE